MASLQSQMATSGTKDPTVTERKVPWSTDCHQLVKVQSATHTTGCMDGLPGGSQIPPKSGKPKERQLLPDRLLLATKKTQVTHPKGAGSDQSLQEA